MAKMHPIGFLVGALLGYGVCGATGLAIHDSQKPLRLAKEQINELESKLTWSEMEGGRLIERHVGEQLILKNQEESALLREQLAFLQSQLELNRANALFQGNVTQDLAFYLGFLGGLVGGICGALLLGYLINAGWLVESTDWEEPSDGLLSFLWFVALAVSLATMFMWYMVKMGWDR